MPDIQAVLAANEKLSQEVLRASGDSIDQSRRFPRENLHALGKSGVLGLLIPAQYGGTGAGLAEMSHVLDVRRMGAKCVIVAEGPGHQRDTELVLSASGYQDALRADAIPFCRPQSR